MEYIDKNRSREKVHTLIKAFLQRRMEEDGTYPEDLYASFRADPECKNALVETLLEDSGHRCCYCMRDIRGTTLEHMIPQAVTTKEEFDKYFEMDSDLDRENIMLTKDFLEHPTEVPPFPHTISYENIFPSCFGNLQSSQAKCCNNHRKDEMVQPLVFRPHIHDEIKYKANGNIVWTEDPEPIHPTLTKLGLDCLELKAIRRIWHYLAFHDLGCEETNREQTIADLLIEAGTPRNSYESSMNEMINNFRKPEYWDLLKLYSYFNRKEIFE